MEQIDFRGLTPLYQRNNSLLESPAWDSFNQLIWFVSIDEFEIYGINLQGILEKRIKVNSEVSLVIPHDVDQVIYAEADGIFLFNHRANQSKLLSKPKLLPGFRFNDGIRDNEGNILIGTKKIIDDESVGLSVLLFVGKDGTVRELLNNLTIPNGMAFSSDQSYLYFCESVARTITRYNYNRGKLTAHKEIIKFDSSQYPDGVSMASNGILWVALWGAGTVRGLHLGEDKDDIQLVFDQKYVTSCCQFELGGEQFLIITSAGKKHPQKGVANVYLVKV